MLVKKFFLTIPPSDVGEASHGQWEVILGKFFIDEPIATPAPGLKKIAHTLESRVQFFGNPSTTLVALSGTDDRGGWRRAHGTAGEQWNSIDEFVR